MLEQELDVRSGSFREVLIYETYVIKYPIDEGEREDYGWYSSEARSKDYNTKLNAREIANYYNYESSDLLCPILPESTPERLVMKKAKILNDIRPTKRSRTGFQPEVQRRATRIAKSRSSYISGRKWFRTKETIELASYLKLVKTPLFKRLDKHTQDDLKSTVRTYSVGRANRLDKTFIPRLVQLTHRVNRMEGYTRWLTGDLHDENIGFIKGKGVVIDYAGV